MEHDGGLSFVSAEAKRQALLQAGSTGRVNRAGMPGFFRSTSNRPGTEVKMVGLAHRAASAAGVVVLRPNGRKSHMDLDGFETRYEAIPTEEAEVTLPLPLTHPYTTPKTLTLRPTPHPYP